MCLRNKHLSFCQSCMTLWRHLLLLYIRSGKIFILSYHRGMYQSCILFLYFIAKFKL